MALGADASWRSRCRWAQPPHGAGHDRDRRSQDARAGGSLFFTASTSGLQGSEYSPVHSMCKSGVVG